MVRISLVQNKSLFAYGIPVKGPAVPFAILLSASIADSIAVSSQIVMNEFIFLSLAFIRLRYSFVISRLENFFFFKLSDISNISIGKNYPSNQSP